jgi:spore maturation protein CgeB
MTEPMRIVILGLSVTSSWGNGHATTYRALVAQLSARGHDVLFLERDVPWYAAHRDLPEPPYCRTALYQDRADLEQRFGDEVRESDLVIVGSFVPEGVAVGEWVVRTAAGVTAFYDIDTPVTLARLARAECDYLSLELIPRYHLYLSFTGGPTLERLERELGSPAARALYCSVDPDVYRPQALDARWDLGYMGTYSADRQRGLERLLLEPAAQARSLRFLVAGPQYPEDVRWPDNVTRLPHVEPSRHPWLYGSQRFTLNLTRADMIAAGWSPSVRLFEAAACGTPIVSDYWEGLETFLAPGREILLAGSAREVLEILHEMPEGERLALGERARQRVLAAHTSAHRARELESYVAELLAREPSP